MFLQALAPQQSQKEVAQFPVCPLARKSRNCNIQAYLGVAQGTGICLAWLRAQTEKSGKVCILG